MAISDAHNGENQIAANGSSQQPRLKLNWRLNWPIYMASLGMVTTITSFTILAAGFKADHNGLLITGIILYLVSAIIWIITISAAITIVLITRTIQLVNRRRTNVHKVTPESDVAPAMPRLNRQDQRNQEPNQHPLAPDFTQSR